MLKEPLMFLKINFNSCSKFVDWEMFLLRYCMLESSTKQLTDIATTVI